MNCVVCAIAKQENQYIYEWAKHHLQIGFSHVHIYDNNDVDGERIDDVFEGTEIADRITIHDVRGQKCMQLRAFQICYEKEEFDWCAFIDIDEFIVFTDPQMNISKFLMDKKDYDVVHLNWMCYGDSGLVHKGEGDVLARLTRPVMPLDFKAEYITIPENAHVKSIVKSGLAINWLEPNSIFKEAQPHTPANVLVCNDMGEPVQNAPWNPMSYQKAYIAHFITKTIEEYTLKVNRRSPTCNNYNHSYVRFFKYNRLTLGKILKLPNHQRISSMMRILKEKILWWNFVHQTPLAQRSRRYQKEIKIETEWMQEIHL